MSWQGLLLTFGMAFFFLILMAVLAASQRSSFTPSFVFKLHSIYFSFKLTSIISFASFSDTY